MVSLYDRRKCYQSADVPMLLAKLPIRNATTVHLRRSKGGGNVEGLYADRLPYDLSARGDTAPGPKYSFPSPGPAYLVHRSCPLDPLCEPQARTPLRPTRLILLLFLWRAIQGAYTWTVFAPWCCWPLHVWALLRHDSDRESVYALTCSPWRYTMAC